MSITSSARVEIEALFVYGRRGQSASPLPVALVEGCRRAAGDVRFRRAAGLHDFRFKRCVRCDAPDDAIGAKFEKASPFRPRDAPTRPLLGQCDAIATGRYISPATYRGRGIVCCVLSRS